MTVLLLDDQHIVSIGSQHNTPISGSFLSPSLLLLSCLQSGCLWTGRFFVSFRDCSDLITAFFYIFLQKKNNGVYINYYTKVLSLYKQLLLGGSCSLIDLAAEHQLYRNIPVDRPLSFKISTCKKLAIKTCARFEL